MDIHVNVYVTQMDTWKRRSHECLSQAIPRWVGLCAHPQGTRHLLAKRARHRTHPTGGPDGIRRGTYPCPARYGCVRTWISGRGSPMSARADYIGCYDPYLTLDEERLDYPRARRCLAGYSDEQLARE